MTSRPAHQLQTSKEIDIRFSEVDSMSVVWHGTYAQYFEDARCAFGEKYGLGYMDIYSQGYYAPLVELSFKFHSSLRYGQKVRVDVSYHFTEAAKIIFDYKVYAVEDNRLAVSGRSVQVFLDLDYQMVWNNPPFYAEWKEKVALIHA